MAVTFPNQIFQNPFAQNSLDTLRPRIARDNKAGEKEDVQSQKADKETTTYNKLDALRSNLANQILNGLVGFGLQSHSFKNGQNQLFSPNMANQNLLNAINSPKSDNKDSTDAITNPAQKDLQNIGKNGISQISAASSIEIRESITYTLSYDSKSGEFSQSIQYQSSFVANFNSEIVDKNGNKIQVQNQLAIGKNFEHQITGGVESLSDTLKEFLEGQTFKMDFDGDLNDIKDNLEGNGLSNALYFIESVGDSVRNAFDSIGSGGSGILNNKVNDLFSNLRDALQGSLEAFIGIPTDSKGANIANKNDSIPKLNQNLSMSEMEMTLKYISVQQGDNSKLWEAKKLDNFEMFFGSLSMTTLKIEA